MLRCTPSQIRHNILHATQPFLETQESEAHSVCTQFAQGTAKVLVLLPVRHLAHSLSGASLYVCTLWGVHMARRAVQHT